MGYRSDAYCHISVTGGDPDNHTDNKARLRDIVTSSLDGDKFHYTPRELDIVKCGDNSLEVSFEYHDSTLYELAQALLATLRNLVDDGWAITYVEAKRVGMDAHTEEPDVEIWTLLEGHIFASNYNGAIGSIRRHGDGWVDVTDTTIVTESNLETMVAKTIAAHIGAASVHDTQVGTKTVALASLGAFISLPEPMTETELAGIIARLLG